MVVIGKHVVLDGSTLISLLTLLDGNDFVVSENFLDEAACSFAGELAVA
jgi:hypothetical protein